MGLDADSVYLSPAPIYHSAPLRFMAMAHRVGATVVMMRRFDAAAALGFIEQYRVTHSQWVPTMFVRMLKLDPRVRDSYDLSSHRCAVHGAAPCPVEVKRAMIDWWGPILLEYYSSTEAAARRSSTAASGWRIPDRSADRCWELRISAMTTAPR